MVQLVKTPLTLFSIVGYRQLPPALDQTRHANTELNRIRSRSRRRHAYQCPSITPRQCCRPMPDMQAGILQKSLIFACTCLEQRFHQQAIHFIVKVSLRRLRGIWSPLTIILFQLHLCIFGKVSLWCLSDALPIISPLGQNVRSPGLDLVQFNPSRNPGELA